MDIALQQPSFLYTVAMFAVVIGVLVFIHELGHYLAARMFGVRAETFSIGFGRELVGWTDRRGTRWKLSVLPLGGYVKFVGDMNASSQPSPEVEHLPANQREGIFAFKPLWQKAIIVAAGPLINFAFAIAIFAAFFMIYGHAYTPPTVAQVVPGSPAAAAGLKPGDRFLSIDGADVDRFEDVVRIVTLNPGHPVVAEIERGGAELRLTITPATLLEEDRFGNRYTRGQLGVASGGRVIAERGPLAAVWYAVDETVMMTRAMADTMVQVVTGRRSVEELGGPLKIAQFSGQQASMGLPNFIQFMALISINLGFINLLPVPMLDGGHLFLYAVEGLRRRPLSPKFQEWAFMSGFAALISLMLFLTWNDLASFGVWEHLAGLLG
jgi:regulator of sigma E protease